MNNNKPHAASWNTFATVAGWTGALLRFAERAAGPLADVFIRLWLAEVFFVSGVLKLAHWDNALFLAAHEYPVTWLDPVTAAYLGAAIELLGPVLLALGLATRFAALAMLVLSLVIQFNYSALDTHLLWAALFGWYVLRGAGAWSLDRALSRGLADSALPFAAGMLHALKWSGQNLFPVYQCLLRAWLACALAAAAFGFSGSADYFPLSAAANLNFFAALLCAGLLFAGLGVRLSASVLIIYLAAMSMMVAWHPQYAYILMLLVLLVLHGPGTIALDALIEHKLKQRFPQLAGMPAFSLQGLPRVVIVGAGFGGLTCASELARAPVQVTLIDRHNYHLFQPLLYQVATASLSPGDIASTVRSMFRDIFNVRVLLGTVTGVDRGKQEVLIGEQRLPYDYLVLATGASHSYFGRDEWAPYAPGLKRIEDATEIRRRMLCAFESAEATGDEAERRSLLTFLIVGGGPTGVELAGAIAELARHGMEKEFRHFDPASTRVILVQAGARILPTFPEKLSATAKLALEKLGVEVVLNGRAEHIDEAGVRVNGERIAARTVLWAAGVVASPAARWLDAEADNAGRLKTGADLSVAGLPNVFAIGDTALSTAWQGNPVPGLAPAAKQGGAYVARVISKRVLGRPAPPSFVYKHLGSLATIGRKSAVADFGWLSISGALAWWLWGAIHVAFLVGLRNRVSVMFDWLWAYLTFQGGTRLITGGPPEAAPPK
ncbi:MAG: FAD-dependent oxidoreductase [Burkholderiales bacterium]